MKLVSADMKLVSGDMRLVKWGHWRHEAGQWRHEAGLLSAAVKARPCQPRGAKARWDCERTSRQACFAI